MSGAPIVLDTPWQGQNFAPSTPIDITTIEAAIVAQLRGFLSYALGNQMVEVNHFPDKPEAYEMRHRIGSCLIIFAGSDYGEIRDIGHVVQERTLEFEVALRIRDLGWALGGPPSGNSPGAYQLIEAVRMALLGFQPNTGCTPMKAVRERFIDRDRQGGVWVYSIWLSTRTVVVENYSPPSWPLFTEGTAMEAGGQTALQVQIALLNFGSPFNPVDTIDLPGNLSAVIVKSANLATTYAQGTDYSLDTVNGIITRIATGGIAPGATVAVSYAYSDVVTALASGGTVPFAPNN